MSNSKGIIYVTAEFTVGDYIATLQLRNAISAGGLSPDDHHRLHLCFFLRKLGIKLL